MSLVDSAWQNNLSVPAADAFNWLQNLHRGFAFIPECVHEAIVVAISTKMKALSGLPKYSHFLNDDTFTVKLVKNKLLNWGGRDKATMDAVALFRLCSESSRLCAKYNLVLEEDSHVSEVPKKGEQRYKEVKALLTICKGLEIVYKQTGPTQAREAGEFLNKKAEGMPKTLLQHLTTVQKGKCPTTPADEKAKAKVQLGSK